MKAFDIDFNRQWRDLAYTRALAKDATLLVCKIAAAERPEWWRWTVWMAGAITCARIEAVR